MTITTKYNVNDIVFLVDHGSIRPLRIEDVCYGCETISYDCLHMDNNYDANYSEDRLCATLDEAMEQLQEIFAKECQEAFEKASREYKAKLAYSETHAESLRAAFPDYPQFAHKE